MSESEHPASPADAAAPNGRGKPEARRKWLLFLAILILVAALVWGVWDLFLRAPSESTDDAYVSGDVIAVTARDSGTVISLYADDTERVLAGQRLVDLDPAAADVELAAATANLGQAVRSVRGSEAQVAAADADVAQAETALQKAKADLERRRGAARAGAIPGEELAHAQDAVEGATAALRVAEGRRSEAQARVQGTNMRTNPAVLAAIATYRQAAIRRSHMEILAPADGTIAKRNVQIGQHIAAGTPLMAVVPLERVWVDANFRETQLANFRIGQPVKVISDVYGGKVVFHGRLVGLSAGSGSAFALLPPQNASGNWIKIVQRVPVRIALDPRELAEHPLLIGLSVTTTVDTHDRSGSPLGREASGTLASQPSLNPETEHEIDRIIKENLGR